MGAWLWQNGEQQKSIDLTSQREVLNLMFSQQTPCTAPTPCLLSGTRLFHLFSLPKVAFLDAEGNVSWKGRMHR